MNYKAAFFSSMFVATISFLSSIYIYKIYGLSSAIITIIGGFFWVGLALWYKYGKLK